MINRDELLARQDLSGTDLNGASLGACDLRGKILRGADLSHAHLGSADLSGADLRNANLYKANLGAANLTGADLRCADLREANLVGTKLAGADLRDAMGLDTNSPVSISHLVRPLSLEETDDFQDAKEKGYFPLNHWGREYALDNKTLYKVDNVWNRIKDHIGDNIFGDRRVFREVKLVQQYKEYSQWAYMISKNGFERITKSMGLKINKR